jgi:hypothetical protein
MPKHPGGRVPDRVMLGELSMMSSGLNIKANKYNYMPPKYVKTKQKEGCVIVNKEELRETQNASR